MTILNTQSSKRGGATHLRAEPAATHDNWTPSTAPEPPMEVVKFLYIFRRFILYKPSKRVTFCQFFSIVSRHNKLYVNRLTIFSLTFSPMFQLLIFNILVNCSYVFAIIDFSELIPGYFMTFSLQKYFLTYWFSVVLLNVKHANLLVFLEKSPYLCKYRKGYKNGCSATPPARSMLRPLHHLTASRQQRALTTPTRSTLHLRKIPIL